jgi:hypothetical protein
MFVNNCSDRSFRQNTTAERRPITTASGIAWVPVGLPGGAMPPLGWRMN